MRRVRTLATVGVAAAAALLVCGGASAAAAARPSGLRSGPTVVVSGLNNPRQLSLVGGRELLIAEAGKGGTTVISSPQGDTYVGASGSISQVLHPQTAHGTAPHRVITGLLSGAGAPDGSFAVGSDGVSSRSLDGSVYIQETYAPKDVLPQPLGSKQDGKLLRAFRSATGHSRLHGVSDITGFEAKHDPDGKGFDSDPYAVLALPKGELVADAAANDVLWVSPKGRASLFHVFPNVTAGPCAAAGDPTPAFPGCNFVPTSLATDRWGHVFVGGLVSEVAGVGRVVELSRNGEHVLHTWTGFTSVDGVAIGPDGSLYVSQLEAAEAHPIAPMVVGVLTRIAPNGTHTNVDVPFAAGVAVDRAGNVFVSAWSVATSAGLAGPGTSGQVWRLHF